MTKVVKEQVEKRPLNRSNVCVYLDSTYIPVRHETVFKKVVYIAIDIRKVGLKEVLALYDSPN